MLRGSPHLGIPLPSEDSLTSIFFADDSTLLSNSLQAAVEQMAIVDKFCSVSGARLNHAKCMTLVLNEHLDTEDIDSGGLLNVLPTGQPTKYLGFLFGHRLPKDLQLQRLSDKFLSVFPIWGGRARTLQGRKLIVSTMMLSMLWHVTASIVVPKSTIDIWQQMHSTRGIQDSLSAFTPSSTPHVPRRTRSTNAMESSGSAPIQPSDGQTVPQ
ncbi:hypothetical protein DAPPUDRAFT_340007 [Daphnia pulex]|uniref:Reverse transcriptase domain-containing protein n=1 Tax=Daphnia pulex TaxID=6669 RepID=E9I3R9_DAPPU|nr:hypothetical protein DAPPUDRAFT_340007 [Daphnia pulex]|eukprot:EFX61360.1 hypothetical protein DAPPUDRAFT_340007 [Daphnia pulex]